VCGIVGYVGGRRASSLLLAGLASLEYRGYDSAGISVLGDQGLTSVRAVGNIEALRGAVDSAAAGHRHQGVHARAVSGRTAPTSDRLGRDAATVAVAPAPVCGIGHTRWATHGAVSERNAHPHTDCEGRVHIVLNGIVENFMGLREGLRAQGCELSSDTDVEVVAHLVARLYAGDLAEAARRACDELEGHYAFAAVCADEPGTIVGVRRGCPLIVGLGEGESFLASAIPAFLGETRSFCVIDDDEVVVVRADGLELFDWNGDPITREVLEVDWEVDAAEKGGYETYMLKEIEEQGDAFAATLAGRLHDAEVNLGDLGAIDDELLRSVERIVIVACGTSYNAGLVARYALEEWTRLPVEIDIASEYRYRNPIVDERYLVVGISQSGETADTLVAMRLARARGAKVLGVANVVGSQISREADGMLYTRAGLEIGVAATKTFIAQLGVLYLLALKLAGVRATLDEDRRRALAAELGRLPDLIRELLPRARADAQAVADQTADSRFFLYLGRHVGLPIALEGALKLKEISYVPTDAYAAGEMKHGPLALLDESTPVVCIATDSPVLEKIVSNMSEVRARGASVVAITTAGNCEVGVHADVTIEVPPTDWLLQPVLAVIPLQLLAYEIAQRLGLNVDQPRNLAKTVTVE
jgi:glucosamine--fructose-6-phosphate aminotransferase (isomerizing)